MTTKTERMQRAVAGDQVDRVPAAMWRHWPGDDQNVDGLVRATLDYQQRFDFDFVKVTPSHVYCVADWGAKTRYGGRAIGDRDHIERVIKQASDYEKLEPLDVQLGALGDQLEALRRVIDAVGPDVPVLATVFNPIGVVRYLTGDERYIVEMRRNPEQMHRALAVITDTYVRYVREAVKLGVSGVFLSSAAAGYGVMSEAEYLEFGKPYDLPVLEAASECWLNILHLHPPEPMFDISLDYPVQAFNWDDRTTPPTLREARQLTDKLLLGGIDQWGVLMSGSEADVEAQAHDAIAQVDGRGLVVTGGCTFPVGVPEGNLHAVRKAVETYPG